MPPNLSVAEPVVAGKALLLLTFDAGSAAAWLTPAELRQLAQDLVRKAEEMEAAPEATVTA